MSCDGDPVPDRGALDILVDEPRPEESPKGDLMGAAEGSPGEVLAVGEVERP